jgi:gliding motility-associated-like protein
MYFLLFTKTSFIGKCCWEWVYETFPEKVVLTNSCEEADFIFSVFNRWVLKVFEGSELFPTWNGIYGGVMLPTADYYYVVELSDGRKFNGVVTLKQ